MPKFHDELIFRADFNMIDEDGFVLTSLFHGSSRRIPRRGERIFLRDGEGNRCWATVHDFRGAIIRAKLDEQTWVAGEETRTIDAASAGSKFAVEWHADEVQTSA